MWRKPKKVAFCWLQKREITWPYIRRKGCMDRGKQNAGICKYLQLYGERGITRAGSRTEKRCNLSEVPRENASGVFWR